jgi:CP family cyanate transporter-like MFS transporter
LTKRFGAWLALVAVLMYALVLRPPLAAVGPLLPLIDEDLGLSLAQQGFLTAIPVFSFGVGAFAGPALAKRLGLERSLFWLLAVLTLAIGLRGWFGFTSLVVGTTVAGLAIAVSNVLLPSVIRGRFSKHVPQVTALFTTVLAISASLAAASAVPIEGALGSWNLTLMVWLAPSALALALWRLALKSSPQPESSAEPSDGSATSKRSNDFGLVLRSKVTWAIFGFFGIQSAGFYVLLSWLPTILIERGYTAETSGSLLGLATIVGVPTGLLLASSFARIKRLDWLAFAVTLVTAAGFLALEVEQSVLACVLIGLGQAATFPLSLTMISTKADKSVTPTLSATTQGLGYVFAGIVAFSMAGIREVSGSWSLGIWIIFGLTLVQAFCGLVADRAKPISSSQI